MNEVVDISVEDVHRVHTCMYEAPRDKVRFDEQVNMSRRSGRLLVLSYEGGNDSNDVFVIGNQPGMSSGVAYVSVLDGRDKMSGGYHNCTGLVGYGIDTDTGEPISFFTHQNTSFFSSSGSVVDEFTRVAGSRLRELKKRVRPETLRVGMFGGMFLARSASGSQATYAAQYQIAATIFGKLVSQETQTRLQILHGPSMVPDRTQGNDVLFTTQNATLHSLRPKQRAGARLDEPFSVEELSKRASCWERYTPDEF